jgi:protein TonB
VKKEKRCKTHLCSSSCLPCSRVAWLASVLIHLAIPFLFGVFFFEGSRYAISSSTSVGIETAVAVELVSSAPVETVENIAVMEALPTLPPPHIEEEFIKAVETKPKPKKPVALKQRLNQPSRKNEVPKDMVQHSNAMQQSASLMPSLEAGASLDRPSLGEGTTSASPDYLRNPPPPYPRESRYNQEEGTVLLSVSLDGEGVIQGISLKQSSRFTRLDEAAMKAVKGWRFKPARVAGIGISSSILVPVKFVLR